MTYSQALEFINEGFCVSRSDWTIGGNLDVFICKQITEVVDTDTEDKILDIDNLPKSAKFILRNWKLDNVKYIDRLIVVNKTGYITSYMPTSEDIFATDWVVYE